MKLSKLVENVCSTDEKIIINKNGLPAAVLVSPEEFEGWKETLDSKTNAVFMDEIKKGLAALKKGAKLYKLEELF
jgi:prevent-host-death family protein